jgi:hypothetical protein
MPMTVLATKPDGEVSGLGDHQSERALQSNPVPRPLHDANPKLTRAWPLTLCSPENWERSE